MKSLLSSLLALLLVTASSASDKEHKAMHTFTTSDDGVCTAYAVGPHSIEVAEHCTTAKSFQLDGKGVRIKETISDHQDHVVLILDGVTFNDFVVLKYREAPVGGRVHSYVNPAGWNDLYDQYLEGYRSGSQDTKSGQFMVFFFPVVGGDSGSLIFNEDGSVAGVVSMGVGPYALSSKLGFTASDLAKAAAN